MTTKTQAGSVLMLCPSFSSYSSIRFAEIADKVSQEFHHEMDDFGLESKSITQEPISNQEENHKEIETEPPESIEETQEGSFEFACICSEHETLTISADELFDNGKIRPIFPAEASPPRISLGKILSLDRQSSTESDIVESIPAGTYCIWTPEQTASSERCKKSNSTGTSNRWRLRDLISRSNSDSKQTIMFVSSSSTCSKKGEKKSGERTREKRATGETGKSPHEILYMRNRALKEGDRRRTFLPYRMDLLGFFVNVNGLSRNIHPF